MGTLNVKLFIECKYINSNNVFWFDAIDKLNTVKKIMTDTPLQDPKKNVTIKELDGRVYQTRID
jgi:hypothetical protein